MCRHCLASTCIARATKPNQHPKHKNLSHASPHRLRPSPTILFETTGCTHAFRNRPPPPRTRPRRLPRSVTTPRSPPTLIDQLHVRGRLTLCHCILHETPRALTTCSTLARSPSRRGARSPLRYLNPATIRPRASWPPSSSTPRRRTRHPATTPSDQRVSLTASRPTSQALHTLHVVMVMMGQPPLARLGSC